MTIEEILQLLINNFSVWTVLKLLILFALVIYLVFAVVVIRQVKLMTNTFKTGYETWLRIISWLHLILVIGIFLGGLVLL